MAKIRLSTDPAECRAIWERIWPMQCMFDLWEVRESFAAGYKRQPCFLIAEEGKRPVGLMALSWVDEARCYMHYPGETWKGRTWLEQNKIPAHSAQILGELLDSVPGSTHLRYLTEVSVPMGETPVAIDEIGYLFYPENFSFSFANYFHTFSGKSRKKLTKELGELEKLGVAYRYDHVNDIQWLYRMNLQSFQEESYFYDPRFLDSMEKLVTWLHDQGALRITTLLLGGTIAAVDIGGVWQETYTVLAGATNPVFPGVAKMINFHHMQWACQQRIKSVDFLCGDFGWKQRFHLSPRPLYEMHLHPERKIKPEAITLQEHACEN